MLKSGWFSMVWSSDSRLLLLAVQLQIITMEFTNKDFYYYYYYYYYYLNMTFALSGSLNEFCKSGKWPEKNCSAILAGCFWMLGCGGCSGRISMIWHTLLVLSTRISSFKCWWCTWLHHAFGKHYSASFDHYSRNYWYHGSAKKFTKPPKMWLHPNINGAKQIDHT